MRTVLWITLVGLALCAMLPASMFFNQSSLIYFPDQPGRALTATPRDIGLDFEEVRIVAPDGPQLHGWFIPAAAGERDGLTVLLCHGNAGNISHRLDWVRLFHDMGFATMLFDYRGYGSSTGKPDEEGTYRDARAFWNYLTNAKALPADRIIVMGESLGGAIAAHLTRDVTPGALILLSTFTSVPDLAKELYPWLPVGLLVRFRYTTAEYVSQGRAPVLVMHSRTDEIVPWEHGVEIARRARDRGEFLEIRGDHNSGVRVSRSEMTEGIGRFLQTHGVGAHAVTGRADKTGTRNARPEPQGR